MKIHKNVSRTQQNNDGVYMYCIRCKGNVKLVIVTPPSAISSPKYFPLSLLFERLVGIHNYFICYECCLVLLSKDVQKFQLQCELCLLGNGRFLESQPNLCNTCALVLKYLFQALSCQNKFLSNVNVHWKQIQPYACVLYKGCIEKPLSLLSNLNFYYMYNIYTNHGIHTIKKYKNASFVPKLSVNTDFISSVLEKSKVVFKVPIGLPIMTKKRIKKNKENMRLKKSCFGKKIRKRTYSHLDVILQRKKQLEKSKEYVIKTKNFSALYPAIERVEVLFMDHSYSSFLKEITKAKDLIRAEQERMERELSNVYGYKQNESENPITAENIDFAERLIAYELSGMKTDFLGFTNVPLLPSTSTSIPESLRYSEIGKKLVESEIELMRNRNPYVEVLCKQGFRQKVDDSPSCTETDTEDENLSDEEYDPENAYL